MTRKRWIAVVSALGIVVAAAITTAAVAGHSSARSKSEDDSPLLVSSSTSPPTIRTTTTHRTTTTVDLAKLPHPDPPPKDAYAPGPVIQIGAVEIPKINVLHPVFEGITLTVIDHGPGHWPGSALPCQNGNSVFPGHRVTHTHPFLDLDLLSPGDKIIFHMPGKKCVYEVTGTTIVAPTALYVTDPTPTPTITLIACNPKHSAAQRIVVKAKLIATIPDKT